MHDRSDHSSRLSPQIGGHRFSRFSGLLPALSASWPDIQINRVFWFSSFVFLHRPGRGQIMPPCGGGGGRAPDCATVKSGRLSLYVLWSCSCPVFPGGMMRLPDSPGSAGKRQRRTAGTSTGRPRERHFTKSSRLTYSSEPGLYGSARICLLQPLKRRCSEPIFCHFRR